MSDLRTWACRYTDLLITLALVSPLCLTLPTDLKWHTVSSQVFMRVLSKFFMSARICDPIRLNSIYVGVNHLGHFALTLQLLDKLKESHGKIVTVSSALHKRGKFNF